MAGTVKGSCDPKFAELKDEFERNFEERGEAGASVCVSVNGETVVDLWGGVADTSSAEPWQEDTVSIVFSCTKAAVALCAHILVDRGELELSAPVSKYWPECVCVCACMCVCPRVHVCVCVCVCVVLIGGWGSVCAERERKHHRPDDAEP